MMNINDPREEALMMQQGLHPDCAVIVMSDFRGKYDLADLMIELYLSTKEDK